MDSFRLASMPLTTFAHRKMIPPLSLSASISLPARPRLRAGRAPTSSWHPLCAAVHGKPHRGHRCGVPHFRRRWEWQLDVRRGWDEELPGCALRHPATGDLLSHSTETGITSMRIARPLFRAMGGLRRIQALCQTATPDQLVTHPLPERCDCSFSP